MPTPSAYRTRAAAIEARLAREAGPVLLTALRAAVDPLVSGDPSRLLEGLTPYPGSWRSRAAPTSVLPHYPLTLHRGGHPDGS